MMIMKRRTLAIATAGICTALLFSTTTIERAYAAEKVINLKIANFFPPPSKQSKIRKFEELAVPRRIKVSTLPGLAAHGPAMFKDRDGNSGYRIPTFITPRSDADGVGLAPWFRPPGSALMALDFYSSSRRNWRRESAHMHDNGA
jgi:hypothetical protein